jgi:PAS domain S-box-containing protein
LPNSVDPNIAIPHALLKSDAGFRVLADTMQQMVWSTLPNGDHDYYNQRWYDFTGVPQGSTDGEGWNGMFHPDDQERARKRWQHSLDTGEPYEIEYRLRDREGRYRWTIGRALPLRDDDGKIVRWIGTCTDIDDAKRQAEQTEILSRELSHRIKYIFAVINGLVALSARNHPEAKEFAEQLRRRIAALGRAHEFARPHSDESALTIGESTLQGILRDLLSPYPAMEQGRISIVGDDTPIDDRGATPMALIFHELATNAAKYGALSSADGEVAIDTRINDGKLSLTWVERGGPALDAPPTRMGFGTRLIDLGIVQQLNGHIAREWSPTGLIVKLSVPAGALSRQ